MTGPERHRRPTDEGFTLVELMVAMIVFSLVMVATGITLTNVLRISYQTSAIQTETNPVLNLSTTLERLVRSEVEPAPPVPVGNPPLPQYPKPTPGFARGGTKTNSMTFYANTGDPNGPALVVAAESPTSNPCTGGGCATLTYTFTVTETAADPNSCPTSVNLAHGAGTGCTYTPSNAKQVISINNVANDPSSQPIFTYTVLHADGTTTTPTPAQINNASETWPGALAPPLGFFDTCTAGPDPGSSCPSDAIESVEFSFLIYDQGAPNIAAGITGTKGVTGYDTTVYRLSSTSYQYSGNVG